MAQEFKLPDLGEGVEEADVLSVLVSEGDRISADQNVIEIETEKASLEVPCPLEGEVVQVHVREGDHIKVGDPLISVNGEAKGGKAKRESAETEEAGREDSGADGTARRKSKRPKRGEDAEDDERAERRAPRDRGEPSDEDEEAPEDGGGEGSDQEKPRRDEQKKRRTPLRDEEQEHTEEQERRPSEARHDEEDETSDQRRAARTSEHAEDRKGEEDGNGRRQPAGEPGVLLGGPQTGGSLVPAPPATRRLARELGVDLYEVAAHYPGKRLSIEDVKGFVRDRMLSNGIATRGINARTAPVPPLPDFSEWGEVERVERSKIERLTGERMSASWGLVPHVTHGEVVDISELESLRRRFDERSSPGDPKLTVSAFLIKAAVHALRKMPRFNATLDAEADELILKRYYHIGVAVDTERGLLVPVIRDCDSKSVLQIAAEMEDVAQRTRDGKIRPSEMRGGSFTLTNVGGIGGAWFAPIINYPEVAILGAARARPELRLHDGQPIHRLMLPICLSYDHRVANGADAARFVRMIVDLLENPDALLLRG